MQKPWEHPCPVRAVHIFGGTAHPNGAWTVRRTATCSSILAGDAALYSGVVDEHHQFAARIRIRDGCPGRGRWVAALIAAALLIAAGPGLAQARMVPRMPGEVTAKTWSVSRHGPILQIGYGRGTRFPQFAALDLRSGYFRMVYGTASGWGTSVLLLPALWSIASCPTDYCQGAPVTARWRRSAADLVLSVHGTIATLKVAVTVTLLPPARSTLVARVTTRVTGTVVLDHRPGEAFKPVMLSSMHDTPTLWDSSVAFIGQRAYHFPAGGWIIHPPVTTRDFGLRGGTSSFKANAPTIEVSLALGRAVTGWLTTENPPDTNDDNVGLWCAARRVLPTWRFTVTAETGTHL